MVTTSALPTLIELANKASDEAAKRLAAALRAHEDARQKLDLLMGYRNDYAARCQNDLANGMGAMQFNNYQAFMQKLDQAIAGQDKVVVDALKRVDQARAAWCAAEQKKMSFTTLNERAIKEQNRRDAVRDQKQSDEFANRRSQPKRTPT
ncbi:MAG: flagellar export protein FliJ [Gammaproteobacteria bacterium]